MLLTAERKGFLRSSQVSLKSYISSSIPRFGIWFQGTFLPLWTKSDVLNYHSEKWKTPGFQITEEIYHFCAGWRPNLSFSKKHAKHHKFLLKFVIFCLYLALSLDTHQRAEVLTKLNILYIAMAPWFKSSQCMGRNHYIMGISYLPYRSLWTAITSGWNKFYVPSFLWHLTFLYDYFL